MDFLTRRAFCELAGIGVAAHVAACAHDRSTAGGTTEGSGDSGPMPGDGGSGDPGPGPTASGDAGSSDASSPDASTGDDAPPDDSTSDPSRGEDSDTGPTACEPSPASIEGPFYRPGMPVRSDLDIYGDPGEPVQLSGRVLDAGCTPVANAVVELWHASPVVPGAEPGDANATYDGSDEYRYYGQVATDADGRYAFATLKPGWYLNGNQYRPAHLHVKIWTREKERLTTQLYFASDPFNAVDPWFDRAMELSLDARGNAEIDFVI